MKHAVLCLKPAIATMAPATERLQQALSDLGQTAKENKAAVAAVAGGATVLAAGAYLYRRAKNAVPKSGPYKPGTLPADAYDAVIVGAGPSGSTCAYFLSKSGAKVALLDKATFPRGEPVLPA